MSSPLTALSPLDGRYASKVRGLQDHFSEFALIRERVAIEATTNHDVKAVEYWLRERFAGNEELRGAAEFIHFACTSEDINNLAHARMVKAGREAVLLPAIDRIVARLEALAAQ